MTDNVLVPFDGSPLSVAALRHTLETFPDASVTVLRVVDLFEPGYGGPSYSETSYEPLMGSEEWYERAEERTERLFEAARQLVDDYDRDISMTSEIGDAARIIVEYAHQEEIEHIVLGAHGRSDVKRPLFGRVAELVARQASVPVTLMR